MADLANLVFIYVLNRLLDGPSARMGLVHVPAKNLVTGTETRLLDKTSSKWVDRQAY